MILEYTDNKYRISYGGLSMVENALGNPNLVQIAVVSGTTIQVAPDANYGITFKSNGEYAAWRLSGINTRLARSEKHFIYARLNRDDDKGLIVFSVNRYRMDGKILKEGEEDSAPSEKDPILVGPYFYVRIGYITATDSLSSPTVKREITIDGGYLTTPQGAGTLNDMFRIISGNLIQPLKAMAGHVVKGTLSIVGRLLINNKEISDVARNVDGAVKEPDDKTVPTTAYLAERFVDEVLGEKFLRKDQEDQTNFLLKFGDFIDSMISGKGTGIFPNGRIQTDRIEVRGSMLVKELIFNRWFAQEGNVTYSEAGTIEKVVEIPDGSYDLYLRKRWENDLTAFAEMDICYGSVNNLLSTGEYFDSWFLVRDVMLAENKLNVTLYSNEEVPGGKNFKPVPSMVITRRGNVEKKERQSFWYISSYEKCICMLDGVYKPILEESNYSIIIGKLKRLSLFDNLPINYFHSYVYCRGIATQDVMKLDYKGMPVRSENFRGFWSLEIAESEKETDPSRRNPYRSTKTSYDTVSHVGCEWMCIKDKTTEEPRFASPGWIMLRGNPAFTIDIDSSEGWNFDFDTDILQDGEGIWQPFTTLRVSGSLYNQDVTQNILDSDITWARDTGDVAEDNAWAIKRASAGKELVLTGEDLGKDYRQRTIYSFKATALLRDNQHYEIAEQMITFREQ